MSHNQYPQSSENLPQLLPGNFLVTQEFPNEMFEELAGRVEASFAKAASLEENPEEFFDVDDGVMKEVSLLDTDDPSGQTRLGIRLQTNPTDPDIRTLTVFSSAYAATSPQKPKVAVSVQSTGLMVASYGVTPSYQDNVPLDQTQALSVLNQAAAQLENRVDTV
jgi:hypothetical protein